MYAVVEFRKVGLNGIKRECAVIPIIWLIENNTKCYWPSVKYEESFLHYVKTKKPYEKSWHKYQVYKILHTTGKIKLK